MRSKVPRLGYNDLWRSYCYCSIAQCEVGNIFRFGRSNDDPVCPSTRVFRRVNPLKTRRLAPKTGPALTSRSTVTVTVANTLTRFPWESRETPNVLFFFFYFSTFFFFLSIFQSVEIFFTNVFFFLTPHPSNFQIFRRNEQNFV